MVENNHCLEKSLLKHFGINQSMIEKYNDFYNIYMGRRNNMEYIWTAQFWGFHNSHHIEPHSYGPLVHGHHPTQYPDYPKYLKNPRNREYPKYMSRKPAILGKHRIPGPVLVIFRVYQVSRVLWFFGFIKFLSSLGFPDSFPDSGEGDDHNSFYLCDDDHDNPFTQQNSFKMNFYVFKIPWYA